MIGNFSCNLNIRYDQPEEYWDKLSAVYSNMPGDLDYDSGIPRWKFDDENYITASVEPSGLSFYGKTTEDRWNDWIRRFREDCTSSFGYKIGEPEEGFGFPKFCFGDTIYVDYIEPWTELWQPAKSFEEELSHELNVKHILYDVDLVCIGRREDRDDFLFRLNDHRYKYAVVHLTFSGKVESNEKFPLTQLYSDLDDFINNRMVPDSDDF